MSYEAIAEATETLTRIEQLNLLAHLANLVRESEEDLEDIYYADKVHADILSGKEKAIPAEEVYKELGL